MKRILGFVLLIALALPLVTLLPQAEITEKDGVYSGKALDTEYIMGDDSETVLAPDEEMSEEELEEWKKQQEASGSSVTTKEDIEAALAPNYHIQFEANTNNKTLRIYCDPAYNSGRQAMLSYAKAAWIPWLRSYIRKNIETAYIEEGVLSVGHYTFYQCQNLKTVYLPHSIEKVDRTVFYMCGSLETIYYAGTEEDFKNNVLWIDSYNTLDYEESLPALDKIHFGEHVTVQCRNEEGHVFSTYTVGGYNVGEAYTITPMQFNGLTPTGTAEYSGKFKKNDDTVYTFTYRCEHEYGEADPEKPCASYCIYCGQTNPDGVPHEWLTTVVSERGFVSAEEIRKVCTVCGYEETETAPPYFWYVLIPAGALAVLGAISFAIAYPIRKKKKLKELTW